MEKYLFLIGICLYCNVLQGQSTRFSGLVFDDSQYDQLPIKSFYTDSDYNGSKMSQLPLAVDLKPYCPLPGNQGGLQSCVGWATGYGAMTIEYAIRNPQALKKGALSALFIYNQIKKSDCKSGSTIVDAMGFLKENGNCYAIDFDRKVRDCKSQPSARLKKLAQGFAVKDFKILFSTDELNAKKKEIQIKKALAANKPVVVGLEVLRSFYELKNAQFWWPDVGNKTPAGGHAMVVVAYDEKRQAFQLMNSWGRNWGDQGFIWIKYGHFAKYCKYGFVMDIKTPTPRERVDVPFQPSSKSSHLIPNRTLVNPPAAEAKMQFLYAQKKDRNLGFRPAAVILKNGIYQTLKQWNVGQLFQLTVEMPDGFSWLYCFSLNSRGETYVHKIQEVKGRGKQQVIIPAKGKALQLEEEGKDQLILLFSKKKITDFDAFINHGLKNQEQLEKDLRQFFKHRLAKESDFVYLPDEIGFQLKRNFSEAIIPVVLEVEGLW